LFPNEAQQAFLRAVFGAAADFPAAWNAWLALTARGGVEETGARLLPLAVPRLDAHGIGGALAAEARLSLRNVRARNVLFLRELSDILALLDAAGIETMLLKGASLLAGTYRDLGLRPMNDLDVAVRPNQFVEALGLLQRGGWWPLEQSDIVDTRFIHAMDLLNQRGTYLDLHCHPILQSCRSGLDDPLWRAAEPVAGQGWQSRRPCPEHQVLQLIAHGLRWTDTTSARWVPDVLLSVEGKTIDWPMLVETATSLELAGTVGPALAWLDERDFLPVPRDALEALAAVRISRREARLRRVLATPMRPGSILDSTGLHLAILAHCRGEGGFLGLLPLIVPYVRSRPGLGGRSLWRVLGRWASRYVRPASRLPLAPAPRS
jgi:hypothetical protein